MIEFAKRNDLFTNTEVIDYAESNPESVRSNSVRSTISAEAGLSGLEQESLAAAADSISPRGTAEQLLDDALYEMQAAGRALSIDILSDTTGVILDTIRARLEQQQSLYAGFGIVDSYLQARDTTSASAVLDSLSNWYLISGPEEESVAMIKFLKELMINAFSQQRSVHELTEAELIDLLALADSSDSRAAFHARHLANFFVTI